jgi:hypothetical protein
MQLLLSIDLRALFPCLDSAQDVSMDAEAVAKFGYHHLEDARFFTLDPLEK